MTSNSMHSHAKPAPAENPVNLYADPFNAQSFAVQSTNASQVLPNSGLPISGRRLTVGQSQQVAMDAKEFLTLAASTLEQGADVLSQLARVADVGSDRSQPEEVALQSAQAEADHLLDTLQAFAASVQVQSSQGVIGLFDGTCDFTDTSAAHAAIVDCRIYRIDLSQTGDKQINLSVEQLATPANVVISGNAFTEDGLASDVAIELRGSLGTETFTFATGTSAEQVAAMVNMFSDQTGVSGLLRNGAVSLVSTTRGSDAQIGLSVISEGNGGLFESNISTIFAAGEDAEGTINGIPAHASGNQLEISTATMDISVTVAAQNPGHYSFKVTGGGVDLSLEQFASRVGIGSLMPSQFVTPFGRLYEIASGQRRALIRDPQRALRIVCSALEYVSGLRERLLRQLRIVTVSESLANAIDSNPNPMQTAFDNSNTEKPRPRFLQKRPVQDMGFSKASKRRGSHSILVQPGSSVLQVGSTMQEW